MSKIYDFLNSNNQDSQDEQEHVCDGCTSIRIHELTHSFEDEDGEEIIGLCLERVFQAIEDGNTQEIIDSVVDFHFVSRNEGAKDVLKEEIHNLSGMLMMRTSEPDGEEQ